MSKKIICLWSSPRNISTALMYSFRQRQDTQVIDEPLYAHYLKKTGLQHPGYADILASQENDGNKVFASFFTDQFQVPVLFCKQMTHHLDGIDMSLLLQSENILFIRNPIQIIASYTKVIPEVRMEDIGIKRQWELYQWLIQNGSNPVVLDAVDLLENPAVQLQKICDAIKIPFYKSMLSWPLGPKPEDGVWAPYWYKNVHKSTGFEKKTNTASISLEHKHDALAEESMHYYELLSKNRLK